MIVKNDWVDKENVEATDLNDLADGITSINVYNEDWSALCDSFRITFPTSDMSFKPTTLRVYLNGSRKRLYPGAGPTGSYDYTETVVSNIGTRFVFYTPPATGVLIIVDYQAANV